MTIAVSRVWHAVCNNLFYGVFLSLPGLLVAYKDVVSRSQTLFLRRDVIAFSISAPFQVRRLY